MSHTFKKKFGQNFLTDTNLLAAIVSDAGICEKDEVLEIGAGEGALTKQLALAAKKVVSFEIDKELEFTLKSLNLENVEFVFGDVLKTPLEEIENHFKGEYKLVANLPYYITTPLLFKFLEGSARVQSLTIMVQKEVALRLKAMPGSKDYGILSVMTQFYGSGVITRNVGRQMFYPVPNVDSAVVRIDIDRDKYSGIDPKGFSTLVRNAFAMRRKTLLNNLTAAGYSKDVLLEKIGTATLAKRAESLSCDDFVALYTKLTSAM